ncbi:Predicted arabinose efflux permease, MFS family [Parafrankia irregularis]|uniref:Predicted arabinose efflux permease, MFS family n=1 Tax=Parafrankia irregularis TaxID=795642 RepID=A0A0S4QJR8_9ACTN|nr:MULTISPECIES: MFS transporter [Parafrankia]MBE3205530.1 MFS transporter [Parafrankia sp. CH37]CUU55572.1 Predicted arabinose efflux permease, MFS family [Parafrankia irregularis]
MRRTVTSRVVQRDTVGAHDSTRSRTGTFAALQVPNFRLFLGGQVVSLCGTWMQMIALGWLVLSLGASGTELGLVTAAQFLPVLLFGAYGGLIADRSDSRRLLICTQVSLAALAALLGILDLTGVARLWMVAALAAAIGLITAVDNPTRQSFVQEMVGAEHLPNAVTLNSVTVNAARVVGPAIAGLVISLIGTSGCFLLNAASFAAVVLALRRMDAGALVPSKPVARAPGQVRSGLAYAMRTTGLRVPLIMMAVVGALAYEFQVVLPLVARETFDGSAATYSLFTGAMGAGAVVGGLFVARRRSVGIAALALASGLFGVVLLLAAAAPTLALEVVALVLVGAASVAFIATGNATVQLSSAPEMRGRVMALWSVAFLGSTPVGGPIAGWVAQTFGARAGLVLAGAAAVAGAFYALASLRKAADRATAAVASEQAQTCQVVPAGSVPNVPNVSDGPDGPDGPDEPAARPALGVGSAGRPGAAGQVPAAGRSATALQDV